MDEALSIPCMCGGPHEHISYVLWPWHDEIAAELEEEARVRSACAEIQPSRSVLPVTRWRTLPEPQPAPLNQRRKR